MTDIVISSGHGKLIRGASGYLDEVDEARRVVNRVAEILQDHGVPVVTFHDDTSTDQSTNLNTIVDFHNEQDRRLDVSIHFNAFETTAKPMGTEVLYISQDLLAEAVSAAIAEAGNLTNRGPKLRTDLFFLNQCQMPAILIEVVFVDSSVDADLYRDQFEAICSAIAETIADIDVSEEEEEIELPPRPQPPQFTGRNWIKLDGSVGGNITVIVNGNVVRHGTDADNVVDLQISSEGDVRLIVNGQDFHQKRSIPPNQCDITATMFGGEDDYNVSAYDETKVLNDSDLYVALPDRFEGERPLVKVHNRATGESAVAEIWDVGPWNTNDPYWATGTRPAAESGTDEKGRETNGAGIDLSPALAEAISIDGMGTVDWEFVKS